MKKISEQAANALRARQEFRGNNTKVLKETRFKGDDPVDVYVMYLFGNEIAIFDGDLLTIKDAGWQTVTTKDRLNAIIDAFSIHGGISQKNWTWYWVEGRWIDLRTPGDPYAGEWVETVRDEWTGTKQFNIAEE